MERRKRMNSYKFIPKAAPYFSLIALFSPVPAWILTPFTLLPILVEGRHCVSLLWKGLSLFLEPVLLWRIDSGLIKNLPGQCTWTDSQVGIKSISNGKIGC